MKRVQDYLRELENCQKMKLNKKNFRFAENIVYKF